MRVTWSRAGRQSVRRKIEIRRCRNRVDYGYGDDAITDKITGAGLLGSRRVNALINVQVLYVSVRSHPCGARLFLQRLAQWQEHHWRVSYIRNRQNNIRNRDG